MSLKLSVGVSVVAAFSLLPRSNCCIISTHSKDLISRNSCFYHTFYFDLNLEILIPPTEKNRKKKLADIP